MFAGRYAKSAGIFRIALLSAFLTFPAPVFSQTSATNPPSFSGVVDFLNHETRSVSLPLGSADGLTGSVFFALLDGQDQVVTVIYPYEIYSNRFWSGPLDPESFSRVGIGTRAVRMALPPEMRESVRRDYVDRAEILRDEISAARREQLLIVLDDLEEQIVYFTNLSKKLRQDRGDLRSELREEKLDLSGRLDRLNVEMDRLRDDLGELEEERDDLVKDRNRLRDRANPPQDRLRDLETRITELNIEIDEQRREIRDLREERRDIERSAEIRGILRIRSRMDELLLDEEEARSELEDLQAERALILMELEGLRVRD